MKIGIVCPYNIYRPGGVQEVIQAQATGLRKLGHQVKVVAAKPKEHSNGDPNVILLGLTLELNTPFGTKADAAINVNLKTIDEMFARENFDVVNFHEPTIPMFSMQLLSRSPAVNVGTFHAKLPDGVRASVIKKGLTPYVKAVIKRLDAITAVSSAASEFAASQTDQPIQIVPNGIDLQKFDPKKIQPLERPSSIKTILYVGRLEERKGVDCLLPAFQTLQKAQSNVRLVIVGDGDLGRSMKAYVAAHNMQDVEFLGFVSEAEKLQQLRSADLFVSPALYGESFGIVLLEAMAMGVPVVAGDNPGYASVMTGDGAISLVSPKDTNEFAERMERLLFEKSARVIWQNWAAQNVRQYDYPKVIKEYEKVFVSALDKSRKQLS